MKAVIYTRWSPRPDADTTQATEAQITICREYCRKKGYEVACEPFSDRDVSGDDETRVGLWQAIDALKRGFVLVAADPERLARSVFLEQRIYRDVERKGARIECVLGGHHGTGYDGEMVRVILSAIRERDKKYNADRTHARMLAHQANGRAMSKHPPYGFREGESVVANRKDGEEYLQRRWEPDDSEQAVIARIAHMASEGLTAGQICRRLRDSGTECRGKAWHRETVRRILAREAL